MTRRPSARSPSSAEAQPALVAPRQHFDRCVAQLALQHAPGTGPHAHAPFVDEHAPRCPAHRRPVRVIGHCGVAQVEPELHRLRERTIRTAEYRMIGEGRAVDMASLDAGIEPLAQRGRHLVGKIGAVCQGIGVAQAESEREGIVRRRIPAEVEAETRADTGAARHGPQQLAADPQSAGVALPVHPPGDVVELEVIAVEPREFQRNRAAVEVREAPARRDLEVTARIAHARRLPPRRDRDVDHGGTQAEIGRGRDGQRQVEVRIDQPTVWRQVGKRLAPHPAQQCRALQRAGQGPDVEILRAHAYAVHAPGTLGVDAHALELERLPEPLAAQFVEPQRAAAPGPLCAEAQVEIVQRRQLLALGPERARVELESTQRATETHDPLLRDARPELSAQRHLGHAQCGGQQRLQPRQPRSIQAQVGGSGEFVALARVAVRFQQQAEFPAGRLVARRHLQPAEAAIVLHRQLGTLGLDAPALVGAQDQPRSPQIDLLDGEEEIDDRLGIGRGSAATHAGDLPPALGILGEAELHVLGDDAAQPWRQAEQRAQHVDAQLRAAGGEDGHLGFLAREQSQAPHVQRGRETGPLRAQPRHLHAERQVRGNARQQRVLVLAEVGEIVLPERYQRGAQHQHHGREIPAPAQEPAQHPPHRRGAPAKAGR